MCKSTQRNRNQKFICFRNEIEQALGIPVGGLVLVNLDNYAAHNHPKVRVWPAGILAGPFTVHHLLFLAQRR